MTIHLDRRALLAGLGAGASAFALPAWAQQRGLPTVPGLPATAPDAVGMTAEGLARVGAMMESHIAANQITGGVTAVARKGKLVHFQGHGMFDREAGKPMPTDALFVMMSSTKPVTGVALMQQIEAGKVSLDDPISKFIPELKTMKVRKAGAPRPAQGQQDDPANLEPANREITIKDLATHTSGLNGSARRANDTLASHMPLLANVPLDFQPGTRWAYSATTGPDVLARVVEITSGVPYDRYLKERIFEPIGMKDTAHNLTDEQYARVVPRYQRRGEAWVRANPPARRTTYFAGSYGLQSTAHDYLLFETMLLNKGEINGKRVLKPESVAVMSSNLIGDLYKGIGNSTRGHGFGVQVRVVTDPAIANVARGKGAFGWGGAYGTMSWTDPSQELVAVIMIQQAVDQVQRDFEQAVQAAIRA